MRSSATLTNSGTAANAPTDTSAMAVACLIGRLILSAINIPIPRPNAVRVNVSNPSSGSDVFAMDIGRDIAYSYRLVNEKTNGKICATARCWCHRVCIQMTNSVYALILAGGSGERFWPLSRRARPKQLLKLVSPRTLLEETVVRLKGLVPNERILVLTNVEQEDAVRELLPNLPTENIVAEPAKRDTAAAVALATAWVAARDHQAVMLVLPADHVIKDEAAFQKTMRTAARAAKETGALVT